MNFLQSATEEKGKRNLFLSNFKILPYKTAIIQFKLCALYRYFIKYRYKLRDNTSNDNYDVIVL